MSGAASYDERSARALRLADSYAAVAEPLRFAAGLFRLQGRIGRALAEAHAVRPLSGHPDRDFDRFLGLAEGLLSFAESEGPPELAEIARARRADEPDTARSRLLLYWGGEREGADDFLSRALLRPYVEALAEAGIAPDRSRREGHCPVCEDAQSSPSARETPLLPASTGGSSADSAGPRGSSRGPAAPPASRRSRRSSPASRPSSFPPSASTRARAAVST